MFKKIAVIVAFGFFLSTNADAIQVKTMDDQVIDLDKIPSELILVNFWAVWCKPCVQEIPELNELYKRFQNQSVTFLAVSISHEKNLIENFLKKNKINFTVAIDDNPSLADFYKVSAMPTTILIDKKHNILFKSMGFSRKQISTLENVIEENLKKSTSENR